jgi:hypothetical protein
MLFLLFYKVLARGMEGRNISTQITSTCRKRGVRHDSSNGEKLVRDSQFVIPDTTIQTGQFNALPSVLPESARTQGQTPR